MVAFKEGLNQLNLGWKEHKSEILLGKSKAMYNLLNFLVMEGFVTSFKPIKRGKKELFKVFLNQMLKGKGIYNCSSYTIKNKTSIRHYQLLKGVLDHFVVLSTSKGIMTQKQALSLGVGGQIICVIKM